MNNRTKIVGATEDARKKLKEGYKPFNRPKSGCTASGCGISTKAAPGEKQESGAR